MPDGDVQKRAQRAAVAKSNAETMQGMGDMMAVGLPILVVVTVVIGILLITAALFRSFFTWAWGWATTLSAYPLIILGAFILFIIGKYLLRKVAWGSVIAFFAAAAIGFAGWTIAGFYYINIIVRPTVFAADFIKALPDGKAPSLYEKVGNKGNVLAQLTVGEKVTVNGISRNNKSYNITANGITGWVDKDAFPEDAAKTLGNYVGLDGIDISDMAVDRQVESLAKKYLEKVKGYNNIYTMSKKTLNASHRVNATTPLLYVMQKDYKKGGELKDEGVKVKLANIVYAKECTIIYITVEDSYSVYNTDFDKKPRKMSGVWSLAGGINTHAWRNSLTATDLDTGEKWKVMPANYHNLTFHATPLDEKGRKYLSSVVFFFPPFKSRNFSLMHEEPALPGTDKAGYGGIAGAMASFFGAVTGGIQPYPYFIDYNFK